MDYLRINWGDYSDEEDNIAKPEKLVAAVASLKLSVQSSKATKPLNNVIGKQRNYNTDVKHRGQLKESKGQCFERRKNLLYEYLCFEKRWISVVPLHSWLADKEKSTRFPFKVPYTHAVLFGLKADNKVQTVYDIEEDCVLWNAL